MFSSFAAWWAGLAWAPASLIVLGVLIVVACVLEVWSTRP